MNNIEWVNIESVGYELTDSFDSGNSIFNDFLKNHARSWQDYGEAATYIIADKEEIENHNIHRIYGYVTINATGLLYNYDGDSDNYQYLSCAEIRMFAIQNVLRKHGDFTRDYSEIIFNLVLENLYAMSTHDIGFKAIFLNANNEGKSLYERSGFETVTGFISPTLEEKLDIAGTTPMILMINDDFMDRVFG